MRQLERPTYQGSLRAIGRYLDHHVFRHITLVETEEGFILRVFGEEGNLRAEGIDLPFGDIVSLIVTHERLRGSAVLPVRTPPLCPTGYEDFFRSLGFELDEVRVTGVRLIELSKGILVSYASLSIGGDVQRLEALYDKPRIDEALTRGYLRRGSGKPRA